MDYDHRRASISRFEVKILSPHFGEGFTLIITHNSRVNFTTLLIEYSIKGKNIYIVIISEVY